VSDPKPVTCPLCGKPALERELVLGSSSARVIECTCVPVGEPIWLDRSRAWFLRNPSRD
jgi:hypothetical protein